MRRNLRTRNYRSELPGLFTTRAPANTTIDDHVCRVIGGVCFPRILTAAIKLCLLVYA